MEDNKLLELASLLELFMGVYAPEWDKRNNWTGIDSLVYQADNLKTAAVNQVHANKEGKNDS